MNPPGQSTRGRRTKPGRPRGATGLVDEVGTRLREAGFDFDQPLVAAVSGGTDSMALAAALLALRETERLEFLVAHFNHALRDRESDLDQAAVASWCRSNRVPCVTGTADGAAWDSVQDLSPEARARTLRYRFLARVARDAGGTVIATGHTADDQAETVLLRVIRGSSPSGLSGMALLSRLPPNLLAGSNAKGEAFPTPVLIVRPLLALSRSDTAAFCEKSGILPRHDPSNDDITVPRNRTRHEILPALRKINPSVSDALVRLAAIAADDERYLDDAVEAAWRATVAAEEPGRTVINRAAFSKLHAAIQARVLIRAYRALLPDGYLTTANVSELSDLSFGRSGTTTRLPGGVRFAVRYRELLLTFDGVPSDCPYPPEVADTRVDLAAESTSPLGGGYQLVVEILPRGGIGPAGPPADGPESPGRYAATFDAESLGNPVTLRNRRPGDRFFPLGAPGERKLQDVLVDARIPREWRDRVPLVAAERGIAWVAGQRIADWARVIPQSRRPAVRLTIARAG